MQSLRIVSSVFNEKYNVIEVVKEITKDDGTIEFNLHTFHPEMLEWLAATYDISDINELIEILVLSPFTDIDPIDCGRQEATTRCRQKISEVRQKLINTIDKTLTNNLVSSVRAAGMPQKYIDAIGTNYKDVIFAHSYMNSEAVQIKRQFVDRQRSERIASKFIPKPTELDRINDLKKKLRVSEPRNAQFKPVTEPTSTAGALPTVLMKGNKRYDVRA